MSINRVYCFSLGIKFIGGDKMFCNKCGKELPDEALFCTGCGNKVKGESAQFIEMVQPVAKKAQEAINSAQKSFNDLKNSIDTEKVAQTVKEKAKGISKPMIAGIVAVVVAVIVGIALLSNFAETKQVREALNNNDANSLYYAFYEARGQHEKIDKYNDLVSKKIDEIIKDLESYDFEEAVKSSDSGAVSEWMKRFGTLLFSEGGFDLYNSSYSDNKVKMEELDDKLGSKRVYCSGMYAMNDGDYKTAISYLSKVSETDDDKDNANKLIEDCANAYIDTVLKDAESKISSGDMSGGLDLLNDAVKELSGYNINIDKVNSKIEEVKSSYASAYAQKAEEAFKNKDAKGAVGNIDAAIELQPDNNEYKVKRSTYEQYYPFALYEEDNMLIDDYFSYDEMCTANDDSEQQNVFSTWVSSDELKLHQSFTYNLSGNYDTVTGKIFIDQNRKGYSQLFYIEAYADGTLIYTSPKMEKGFLPQDIIFNVTNVQNLEIQIWGKGSVKCSISNFVAQKDFPQ